MGLSSCFNAQDIKHRMSWLFKGPVIPQEPLSYNLSCPVSNNIPDHWEFIDYAPADIHVGCIRAHAKGDPKSKITFITGFKSNPSDYNTPQVRALQRAGIEIDIIPLPDPGTQIGYLQDNKKIVHALLQSNPPPGGFKEGIPNYIFGHSLGGRAFISNMLDNDFSDTIEENYAGAVLIAPHFSSPYRSSPILNRFYNAYCRMFSEKSYGEAPLDWTFSAVESVKKALANNGTSESVYQDRSRITSSPITTENTATTHGQILYSNIEGENLEQRIRDEGVPDSAKDFPLIMIGGSKDFVSCKNYISNVAEHFDAKFYEFDTYHNPFLESKKARDLILTAMKDMTDDWHRINIPQSCTLISEPHNGHHSQVTASEYEDPMPGLE
ncbi:MAG: hypothetical protein ACRBCK_05825 [Alphaproteobacteria bacterium]